MNKKQTFLLAISALATFPTEAVSYDDSYLPLTQENDSSFAALILPSIWKNDPHPPHPPPPPPPENPEKTKALQCLHFIETHLDEDGLFAVHDEDISYAEKCLDLFTESLLGS